MTLELIPRDRSRSLAVDERIIEQGLGSFVAVGEALARIRDGKKYRDTGDLTWDEYLKRRWPDLGKRQADRTIAAAATVKQLGPIGPIRLTEGAIRPLVEVAAEERETIWERVLASRDGKEISAVLVSRAIEEYRAERDATVEPDEDDEDEEEDEQDDVDERSEDEEEESPTPEQRSHPEAWSLPEWDALVPEMQAVVTGELDVWPKRATFNRTNDMVEWALWTWNPVTGCDHGCNYCYARDITQHFPDNYPYGFNPTFWPHRLTAPDNMRVPAAAAHNIGEKNVFVCSMADLFGKWVPQAWIDAVFRQVEEHPEWNFLFLTKFPQRLAEQAWPSNAWCGTTVDTQARVATAERAFAGVQAGIKWLSCEPLLERLTFSSLEMFDWVVIGSSQRSTQTAEFQPPWEWVEHLITQARAAGCQVYIKQQLTGRPREYPTLGMRGNL